jgi:hypothetical protein
MRENRVSSSQVSWPCVVARSGFVLALLIVLANAALAYTVVFRDGHKVDVPPVFTLTATTMTYEAAPGINRTIQLILIDVAATERANSEAPGGFFKHAERNQSESSPAVPRRAQRTLTNLDLEANRQRRLASEQTYEKRRIELGLPSIEETRRRQAKDEEETMDLVRRRAAATANDEAYWRSRAGALRREIVTVDAEINFLRGRVGPVRQGPFVTQSFVTGAFPFGGFEAFGAFGARANMTQRGAGRMGAQGASGAGLTNLGAVALRPRRPSGFGFPRVGIGSALPNLPYTYYDNSYDLSLRLNDLLQRRAGLEALWRELEQDARLAKAPQIWLAP